nr:MAG TPA: hypothetical protein [Caudoviricetes sp.]
MAWTASCDTGHRLNLPSMELCDISVMLQFSFLLLVSCVM